MPCLVQHRLGESGVVVRLGHELVDDYLRFVAARCRPNSVLAAGFDLKVFFAFVTKDPTAVTTGDVLDLCRRPARAPPRGQRGAPRRPGTRAVRPRRAAPAGDTVRAVRY